MIFSSDGTRMSTAIIENTDAEPRTDAHSLPAVDHQAKLLAGSTTRYDKLAVHYQATIHITAINEWATRTSRHGLDAVAEWLPRLSVMAGR